jgi:predicted dehydrogenase
VQVWQFADGLDSLEEVQTECNNDIDSVYGEGHTLLYSDWLNAIKDGRKPLVDGQAGKVAMSIILHAYEAQKNGRKVSFGERNLKALDFGNNDITLASTSYSKEEI